MMRLFCAAAAAGLMAGCSGLFGDGPSFHVPDEVIAAIATGFHEDTVTVHVPDTVRVGERFPVSVETYWGCRLSPGRTEIRERAGRMEIIPFMKFEERSMNCPSIMMGTLRTVSVRFDRAPRSGAADRRKVRQQPSTGEIGRPVIHEPSPPLEQVRAPVRSLHLIADLVRERRLGHLARMVRLLRRPVP